MAFDVTPVMAETSREPEWLAKARAEGRVTEQGINRGVLGNLGAEPAYADHVDLPLPPSTNNLYINRGRGRVKAPAYRDWIASVESLVMRLKPLPSAAPFSITYTLVGGSDLNLGRDLGNIEKPLTDALVKAKRISNDSLRAGLHQLILRYLENSDGSAYVRVETSLLT